MPVSTKHQFICKECQFKKIYILGDNRTILDIIKKCPKCGGVMEKGEFLFRSCKERRFYKD